MLRPLFILNHILEVLRAEGAADDDPRVQKVVAEIAAAESSEPPAT